LPVITHDQLAGQIRERQPVSLETAATPFLYHVNGDGSELRKVVPNHVLFLYGISPDGEWLAVWEEKASAIAFFSSDGTRRIVMCETCGTAGGEDRGITPPMVSWSRDGKRFYLHETPTSGDSELVKTYVIALQTGRMVPDLPASGFQSRQAVAHALGARLLSDERAFLSPDPSVYAFPRPAVHRNIFRIRMP